jgi:Beta-propeller repeat
MNLNRLSIRQHLFRANFCSIGFTFFLFATLLTLGSAFAATPLQPVKLKQFMADGHVLGFKSNGFYIAGRDHMLQVDFVGSVGTQVEAVEPGAGDGPAPLLTRVTYPDLWPGITLHYDAVAGGIARSTWEIDAGADTNGIRLRYHTPVSIEKDGSLTIKSDNGWMHESAPIAWQEINGHHQPVKVAFRQLALSDIESVIGFEIGRHDPAHPLLIDPTLKWYTFLGGPSYDGISAIAVDNSGNIYVSGDSGASWGNPVKAFVGGVGRNDVFVAKLNGSGDLQWNTFIGSTNYDHARGVAVDGSGNVYVAATLDYNSFAVKLNSRGVQQWQVQIVSSPYRMGIALDGSRNVYVTGTSDTSWGNPVNAFTGGPGFSDGFVAKLDNGGTPQWHTFMGSTERDSGYAIAVDGGGNVYVAGESMSSWGTPVTAHAGGGDAFIAKLDNTGVPQWNTFMGSPKYDRIDGITLGGDGDIFVVGLSRGSWGTPRNPYKAGTETFAAKLNKSGVLQWHTFMGSGAADYGEGIAVDNSGNVYIAGHSNAPWGRPAKAYAGRTDCFVAKLDGIGVRQWHMFLGSPEYDVCRGIAFGGRDYVYTAGSSEAPWSTLGAGIAGGSDAFVAKISEECKFFTIPAGKGKTTTICL